VHTRLQNAADTHQGNQHLREKRTLRVDESRTAAVLLKGSSLRVLPDRKDDKVSRTTDALGVSGVRLKRAAQAECGFGL